MSNCHLCPRQCLVNRMAGQRGFCGASATVRVARAAPHTWEEPCISGTRGAGAVFFSHCTLGCVYCQNRVISGQAESGTPVSVERLSALFLEIEAQGVHNLELVTPSHYAPQIIHALRRAKQDGLQLPMIYNCGGYESLETLRSLDGLIDVYLPDFKYYSSYYAARYSGVADYFEIATDAVAEMVRQTGDPLFSTDHLLIRGTLVRHLMLPTLIGDTMQVLRHLATRFSDHILVSLMRQYTPPADGLPDFPELQHTITEEAYREATEAMLSFGLTGYLQEGDSVSESFIPIWNDEQG